MKLAFATILIMMVLYAHYEAQNKSSSRNIQETIICKGLERTYILHFSTTLNKAGFYPLVIALHGGGGDAKGMVRLTEGKFDSLADRDGFIIAYPNGIDKHWNDGRREDETGYSTQEMKIDDIGFISDLIDKLVRERNADPLHVYITGMSNGAMMTYRCGCELSEKITAIAPVAGNIPDNLIYSCKPGRPVSLLAINNTKDPLMPFSGGEVTGPFGKKKIGKVLSAKESIGFWIIFNGCKSKAVISDLPDIDPKDGTRIQLRIFNGGKNNTEVQFYAIEGGGHTWPGGYQYLGEWIIGKTSRDMDACGVIWEFFKRH
jgi:polyhydroxybutyrate depolymerase